MGHTKPLAVKLAPVLEVRRRALAKARRIRAELEASLVEARDREAALAGEVIELDGIVNPPALQMDDLPQKGAESAEENCARMPLDEKGGLTPLPGGVSRQGGAAGGQSAGL